MTEHGIDLVETREKLEKIKEDLKFQLTFEHIDWDYFKETADRAKVLEDICNKEIT